MTGNVNTDQLPVFVILDYTGPMWSQIPNLERHLRVFIEKLQSDRLWPHVELIVIGMGGKTGTIKGDFFTKGQGVSLARRLPICRLDKALGVLVKAIEERRETYQGSIEVFLIMGNDPGKRGWQEPAGELEDLNVNLSPVFFAHSSTALTEDLLRQLKTGTGNAVSLQDTVANDEMEWLFQELMTTRIKRALANDKRTGPAAGPAEPAEPTGKPAGGPVVESPTPQPQLEGGQGSVKHMDIGFSAADELQRELVWPESRPEQPPTESDRLAMEAAAMPHPTPQQGDPVERPQDEASAGPVQNEAKCLDDTDTGWRLLGASRQGSKHASAGAGLEDAFALGMAQGWQILVLTAGCDACLYSYRGAQLAAEAAMEAMTNQINLLGSSSLPAETVCEIALRQGLESAWESLKEEAESQQSPLGDLGTAFLSILHHPGDDAYIVGTVQVGGGLVAAEMADGRLTNLGQPTLAGQAGRQPLLTDRPWKDWLDRAKVSKLMSRPRLVAAMSASVERDFAPFEQHLPSLLERLHGRVVARSEGSEKALLDLLGYELSGSDDDRTLLVMYPLENRA